MMEQMMQLRDPSQCRFDCISLGEVMLRLDPGESRIHTSRSFVVWEGGGEYNVARGLRRCFGFNTAVVTSFVDNRIGRLLEDCILQGGVSTELLLWKADDGVGRRVRNGLNFTERGFGIRGALGVSDRGNSAASRMKKGDVDWDHIFGSLGSRWFHTGGIFAALSDSTPELILEAAESARRHGTVVSYDLNYRPSLWKDHGGKEACRRINSRIAEHVDLLIGNEEDFEACLGFTIPGNEENYAELNKEGYRKMITAVQERYPNLSWVATTLRSVKSASVNGWDGILCSGEKLYESDGYPELDILDRVGGGDSFAAGLIYGFLSSAGPQRSLELGLAHGALAMTTPGDTSMASLKEVEALVAGQGARVVR